MYEHEFFVELLSERELRRFAKTLGVKPKGFNKGVNIPEHILRNSMKKLFANGYNRRRSNGYHLYDALKMLGNKLIKTENFPSLKGDELLKKCGRHPEIPDALLISYLFVCDEELYHKLMDDWVKSEHVEGRLFQKYCDLSSEELIYKMFAPRNFVDSDSFVAAKKHLNKVDMENVPEKVTFDDLINFKGSVDEAAKLIYNFLQQEENKDSLLVETLWNSIACWSLKKEVESIRILQKELEQYVDDLKKEAAKTEKELSKTQEKLNKNNKKITELQNKNNQLTTKNKELTNELHKIKTNLGQYKSKAEKLEKENIALVKANESLTKAIEKYSEFKAQIKKIFKTDETYAISNDYKELQYKANILTIILPDENSYLIATRSHFVDQLPSLIPKSSIVDISKCYDLNWYQQHEGKTLYLHRESFGTSNEFEKAFQLAMDNNLNPAEVNALDESDWIKELIKKGVE